MADDLLVRARAICNNHMRIHIITDLIEELIAEVERLRSLTLDQQYMMDDMDKEIAAKDARIKELEADKRRLEARVEYCHDQTKLIELLEAAFLKARQCPTCKGEGTIHPIGQPIDSICPKCLGDPESMAREALEKIKAGGKDEDIRY